jgi:hypothetical protein
MQARNSGTARREPHMSRVSASSGPTSLNRNSASSPRAPGADVDPVPTRAVIAALDVVSRVRPVLGGEPDHHRAARIDRRGPPARPDQLITGTGQGVAAVADPQLQSCQQLGELPARRSPGCLVLAIFLIGAEPWRAAAVSRFGEADRMRRPGGPT